MHVRCEHVKTSASQFFQSIHGLSHNIQELIEALTRPWIEKELMR